MAITFYYGSGSPYAWRVWLALEHKQLAYEFKLMSFSSGDLQQPPYLVLNPRGRVPVLVDDGFALFESAAIVEYLEDRFPNAGPALFPLDVRERAIARRLVREADQYIATPMETLVEQMLFTRPEQRDAARVTAACDELIAELDRFEGYVPAEGFLLGALGAADFTLYPMIALTLRIEQKKDPALGISKALGPRLLAWMTRLEALPSFSKTFPPHWREA
jgi:glutathione S-transferase